MSEISFWLAVAGGGALGAVGRGIVLRLVEARSRRPGNAGWAEFGAAGSTVFVNVLGSFLLGTLAGNLDSARDHTLDPLLTFWATGVCGALTTFSTICADSIGLARTHGRLPMLGVLFANIVFGIAALGIGFGLAG